MNDPVRIELLPLGTILTVERGTPLRDALFAQGVEFPCGGHGRCKGCRIKTLKGSVPVTGEDARRLRPDEIEEGWRLACQGAAQCDLTLELAQWDTPILADHSPFAFTPQKGLGIAIDLGTTTIVAQLLDLETGHVLAVATALNAQSKHGADIMSRIEFALQDGGQPALERLVREQIHRMIADLLATAKDRASEWKRAVLVGNTVMHHLFCGHNVAPLSHHPFQPEHDSLETFTAFSLGWPLPADATVQFLPCLGGFVGSDILAGVLATKLHERASPGVLVDLGTNGEIVIGNREQLLCASTAAGPAFEGARISMGMRAATGAIAAVRVGAGEFHCRVLGNVTPRGICGSGLVDAAASGLDLGRIKPDGHLAEARPLRLAGSVELNQADVRQLQLAKGAIAAGLRILARQWGVGPNDLTEVYLAGAFGNYIDRESARRIGLFDFPPEKIVSAGNTALLGAKLALFSAETDDAGFAALRQTIRHVPLNEDPQFQDVFVEEMRFPR